MGVNSRRAGLRDGLCGILAALAALLLVLGTIGTWTSNTALDTDKFVERVGPIIDQPAVQTAISTELSNQIIEALNLRARIAPALPETLSFLAAPIASGADDVVRAQVAKVVASEQFRRVWYRALAISQEEVAATLTGSNDKLLVVDGVVTVDLVEVVTEVLRRVGAELPTVLGESVALSLPPDASGDQVRKAVSKYLGVDLTPNFANIPIMDASSLESAQTGVKVVNAGVIVFFIVAGILLVTAIGASTRRRRTTLQFGLSLALVTGVIFFVIRAVNSATVEGITNDTLRPAAEAALLVIFSSLRVYSWWLVVVGVAIALVAYLAGPGKIPAAVRGGISRAGRHAGEVATDVGAGERVAANLDRLRMAGVVLAVVVLLFWSTWWSLGVVVVLLTVFEVGVTVVAAQVGSRIPPPDSELDG